MNILITGTTKGIGRATAIKFLREGHEVYGVDILPSSIEDNHYHHYICDIRKEDQYPELPPINILVNNAGIQGFGLEDINTNLIGLIRVTEKYAFQKDIKSVVMIGSASGHTGAEFPEYAASKGGVLTYTKSVASKLALYKATCNSLDFGGVITELNTPVIQDKEKWQQIMDVTPLKRWMTPEECADWVYFIGVVNKACTGQNILIDEGENDFGSNSFIW